MLDKRVLVKHRLLRRRLLGGRRRRDSRRLLSLRGVPSSRACVLRLLMERSGSDRSRSRCCNRRDGGLRRSTVLLLRSKRRWGLREAWLRLACRLFEHGGQNRSVDQAE